MKKEMKKMSEMTVEELQQLIAQAKEEIQRKRATSKVFTLHFEYENDPRKGKPYAAKLFMKDGKLQRKFFDLNQSWGKHSVLVSGDYEVHAGDVVEERQGGSWKNDYRYWYVIDENGQQILAADIDDAKAKARVLNYLAGKITLAELLNELKESK